MRSALDCTIPVADGYEGEPSLPSTGPSCIDFTVMSNREDSRSLHFPYKHLIHGNKLF